MPSLAVPAKAGIQPLPVVPELKDQELVPLWTDIRLPEATLE